jgi:hypothetical protein
MPYVVSSHSELLAILVPKEYCGSDGCVTSEGIVASALCFEIAFFFWRGGHQTSYHEDSQVNCGEIHTERNWVTLPTIVGEPPGQVSHYVLMRDL